jgi:DNA replication protein DnaC
MNPESSDIFPSQQDDWRSASVPEQFRTFRLDDMKTRSKLQADALEAAKRYAADIAAGGRHPLVIYGAPGSGKTMLAAGVWNKVAPYVPDRHALRDVRDAGTADNVVWVRGDALVTNYWVCKEPTDRRTKAQHAHHLVSANFAVLDDIDKHLEGTWASQLFGLIDDRCCQYLRPTVITMNLTPAGLAKKYGEVGDPIVSRLVRMGAVFVRVDRASTRRGDQKPTSKDDDTHSVDSVARATQSAPTEEEGKGEGNE